MQFGMAALTTQYRLLANYSNIIGQSGHVLKSTLLMHNNFA